LHLPPDALIEHRELPMSHDAANIARTRGPALPQPG